MAVNDKRPAPTEPASPPDALYEGEPEGVVAALQAQGRCPGCTGARCVRETSSDAGARSKELERIHPASAIYQRSE